MVYEPQFPENCFGWGGPAGKTVATFTTRGMGRIPEDRHEGVVGELTVQRTWHSNIWTDFPGMVFSIEKPFKKC